MIHRIELWKALLAAPVFFLLPGYGIVRALASRRDPNLTLTEAFLLYVSCSIAWTLLAGFVLAELSLFSLPSLFAVDILAFVACYSWAAVRERRLVHRWRRDRWWWTVGALFLLALSFALFFGANEYMGGLREQGRIYAWATNIAARGNLEIVDPDIAALTPGEFDLLYDAEKKDGAAIPPGMALKDAESGTVEPLYFNFYGVPMALAFKLVGLRATLSIANPLLAVMALAALAFLVRRLLGDKVALLAWLLLAVNGIVIYFARYQIPELLCLLFLALGLFAFDLFIQNKGRAWGVVAAVAIGLTFTARFEMYAVLIPVLLVVAVLAALMAARGEKSSDLAWFLVPLALSLCFAVVSQYVFTYYYMRLHIRTNYAGSFSLLLPVAVLALMAIIVATGHLWQKRGARLSEYRLVAFVSGNWRVMLGISALLVIVFLYFIRPLTYSGILSTGPNDKETFKWLFWYLTPVLLVLLGLGVYLFCRYNLDERTLMFFGLGVIFTLLFTIRPSAHATHVWVMRRYVDLVIPFVVVLAAYGLVKLPSVVKRRWLYAVSAAVVVTLIVLFAQYDTLIVPDRELKGNLALMRGFQSRYGSGSDARPVVMFAGGTDGSFYLRQPLRYMFGLDSYDCWFEPGKEESLHGLVSSWKGEGREVFLVTDPHTVPRLDWGGLWVRYKDLETVSLPYLQSLMNEKPTAMTRLDFVLESFSVNLERPPSYGVDMGSPEADQVIVYGYYAPEKGGGRWAANSSMLSLPVPRGSSDLEVTLRLSMASRGKDTPVLPVVAVVDGRYAGTIEVRGRDAGEYSLVIGRDILASPEESSFRLELSVPAWIRPGKTYETETRLLGVIVISLSVSAAP